MTKPADPTRPEADPDPAEERGGVEEGPEPATPTPWFVKIVGGRFVCLCLSDTDTFGLTEQDAAAIVHRVNNWPALLAERDALREDIDAARSRAFGDPVDSDLVRSLNHQLTNHQETLDRVIAERDAAIARAEKAEADVERFKAYTWTQRVRRLEQELTEADTCVAGLASVALGPLTAGEQRCIARHQARQEREDHD